MSNVEVEHRSRRGVRAGLAVAVVLVVLAGAAASTAGAAGADRPAPPGTLLVSHVTSGRLPLRLRSLVGTDAVVATWTFRGAGARGVLGVVDCGALARLTPALQGCEPGTTRYRGAPPRRGSGQPTRFVVGPRARAVTVAWPPAALQWGPDAAGIAALASDVVVSPQDTSIRWIDLGVPSQLVVATGGDAAVERRLRALVGRTDPAATVTSGPRRPRPAATGHHRTIDVHRIGILLLSLGGIAAMTVGLAAVERSLVRRRSRSAGRSEVGRR